MVGEHKVDVAGIESGVVGLDPVEGELVGRVDLHAPTRLARQLERVEHLGALVPLHRIRDLGPSLEEVTRRRVKLSLRIILKN